MNLWYNRKEVNMEDACSLAAQSNISPALAMILLKREITDVSDYLSPNTSYMRDPRILKDSTKACELIKAAILEHKSICIINDYDVDGITSGEIMRDVIDSLGGTVCIKTPDRNIDGYGISRRLIDAAKADGCSVIVTTDNGISAKEQIAYAKELGFTVIVTDHHEVPFEEDENGHKTYLLPSADAIVDPKQADCPYPFKEICGASVAFKIASILLDLFQITGSERSLYLCRWGELCAIGTICDVMPLIDENRMYVSAGLSVLRNGSYYVGICKLLAEYNIKNEDITSHHIGFTIGPCLNSSGRMTGSSNLSQKLLLEKDHVKAGKIAVELKKINELRKTELEEPQKMAFEMMEDEAQTNKRVQILYIPNISDSLCGIIAGRCKEAVKKPCIVLSDAEDGNLKGSGRSIEGFDLFQHLLKHKDLFESVGGHPLAAGMTLSKDNLSNLDRLLNEDADKIDENVFVKAKMRPVDLFISKEHITDSFVSELSALEPFGNGNEKPIFCEELAKIKNMRIIGKNNNTLKINFFGNEKITEGVFWGNIKSIEDAIKEQYGSEELKALYNGTSDGILVDVLYYPSFNYWNGQRTIQFVLNDIRISNAA